MLTFDASTHEYRWDGIVVPSVTQILEGAGLKPPYAGDGSAAKRGTRVHELLEAYDKGTLDYAAWQQYEAMLPPERRLQAYLGAYLQFCRDAKVEWTYIEHQMYSQKYSVAGTMDRLGLVNGYPAVVDYKTTSGVPPTKATAAQIAGYHILFSEETDGMIDSRHFKRFALALRGDGNYKLIEYDNPADYAAFKSAATLYHWTRQK